MKNENDEIDTYAQEQKIQFPKIHKVIINTTCSIPLTARHWINERLKGMSGKRKGS